MRVLKVAKGWVSVDFHRDEELLEGWFVAWDFCVVFRSHSSFERQRKEGWLALEFET